MHKLQEEQLFRVPWHFLVVDRYTHACLCYYDYDYDYDHYYQPLLLSCQRSLEAGRLGKSVDDLRGRFTS